jgi:hypothetical protein
MRVKKSRHEGFGVFIDIWSMRVPLTGQNVGQICIVLDKTQQQHPHVALFAFFVIPSQKNLLLSESFSSSSVLRILLGERGGDSNPGQPYSSVTHQSLSYAASYIITLQRYYS